MGTIVRITVIETRNDTSELINKSFEIVEGIEKTASVNIDDSELSQVNNNAYKTEVPLSDALYDIISRSLRYCEASGGAFDIGIGALIDLWGIGIENAHIPDDEQLQKFIDFHGYEHIVLDDVNKTVHFDDERVMINLGACAKGYAEDKVSEYLKAHGVSRFILDFGGSISEFEGGYSFSVRSPDGGEACSATAKYASLATSGDYERFFEENGIRYHHILDSKTGFPAVTGVHSVTVNADSAFEADCLSTAFFVLGEQKGTELLRSFNCEYIIIGNNIVFSDGLS